jgi:predicted amidophosphoribosyltransferase
MLLLAGPDRCASCGWLGAPVCAACAPRLVGCPPLEAPPPLTRLVAGFLYEGPARDLVLGLKLRGVRACAAPLAGALALNAWREGVDAEVVTWVPGTPGDVRARGYDHAGAIAGRVAALLGLPVRPLLRLERPKADQTALAAAQRRANLDGAFVARPVHGRVALVDDVMTTGTTICTCARALVTAGASAVEGLVGCRA